MPEHRPIFDADVRAAESGPLGTLNGGETPTLAETRAEVSRQNAAARRERQRHSALLAAGSAAVARDVQGHRIEPHAFEPSAYTRGACRVCGHNLQASFHNCEPARVARDANREGLRYRDGYRSRQQEATIETSTHPALITVAADTHMATANANAAVQAMLERFHRSEEDLFINGLGRLRLDESVPRGQVGVVNVDEDGVETVEYFRLDTGMPEGHRCSRADCTVCNPRPDTRCNSYGCTADGAMDEDGVYYCAEHLPTMTRWSLHPNCRCTLDAHSPSCSFFID